MNKIKNNSFYIKLPIFLALALVCGIFIGAVMSNNSGKSNVSENYLKYMEILNLIDRNYVDTVNIDDLVDYSIDKMLEKLDPHTAYIPKKDIDMARSQLEGNFEGIGIEFNIIKDTILVVAPISGGPSETVGLLTGDRIIKVDDKTVAGVGITNMDVFGKLRGKKGTLVKVSILRKGTKDLLDYTITRDKIPTFSVDVSYMIDKKTGYIKISRFAENTYFEFKEALTNLKAKGMKQLILDLKENPGGYMDRATDIADEFLGENKLIVYTDGKGTRYDQKILAEKQGDFEEGAVIVLINEGSASASEIVSGALQDNDRALIVGRRSFGKGLVQRPITLSDQSELRLTISRYYTPSGRCIQKPYDKEGIDKYNSDLLNRYKKGEYFSADSVKFDDSLTFKTVHGRTVYGGGGIMPDVFVPRDTSDITDYLLNLFNKNLIREYTLEYYTNNKVKLQAMKFDQYKAKFEITDEMLNELVALGTKSGVKYNEVQFNKSKNFIKANLKAYIARSLYGNSGFYPIINETDEIYMAALKQFAKAKALAGEEPEKSKK
ncbi:MAG TPA: S41 family peptidase [Cytophagaceae bacterium]|jgi:carboxyl-terminal processing protease|nr:S41 family peptidase [Cytophagaceae bacterium]